MKLSENALEVLKFRYLDEGETPEDRFKKVAEVVASVENPEDQDKWKQEFYEVMSSLKFLPNTPCLVNAGKALGQLIACFVIPVEDSIPGIFNAIKHAAIVHKSGGGTGFSFSRLRPEGTPVSKTRGVSSGPVSFMRVFDQATHALKQGGVRRGANMGIMRVSHPDIMDFIKCKRVEGDIANFNISVGITDDFMEAILREEEVYNLWWTDAEHERMVSTTVNPNTILDAIIDGMYENGEPGIVFLTQVNDGNPLGSFEVIESTNPCGEQPLPPFGSCVLGSINLGLMVVDEDGVGEDLIDWKELERVTRIGVRFLDNVIDASTYPLEQIRTESLSKRRIGLGIMGLADMFLKTGIRYGSPESLTLTSKVMSQIEKWSQDESEWLGSNKGIPEILETHGIHRRNGVLRTVAPTGSVSIIAGCSSGIEPVFAWSYEKKWKGTDGTMTVYHPLVTPGMKLPSHFVKATEITTGEHLAIQNVVQKYVDAGISKTVIAPNNISKEEIRQLILRAWSTKLKGLAFYRDGSRKLQALTDKETATPKPESSDLPAVIHPSFERPALMHGFTERIGTSRGRLYVTVNSVRGMPFEVFLKIGKSGADEQAYCEALGRTISLGLRSGVSVQQFVRHLKDIGGTEVRWTDGRKIQSVPDAVSHILGKHFSDKEKEATEEHYVKVYGVCDDCGSTNLEFEGNCFKCLDCGWTKCS